jgi:hypothetical protein
MNSKEIGIYVKNLNPEQNKAIQKMRAFVLRYNPSLKEKINKSKWLTGLIMYSSPTGVHAYALGPRGKNMTTFHMMPYYGSPKLQAKHGAALKKFLTGKSCIQFKNFEDLPKKAMMDIIKNGTKELLAYMTREKKSGKAKS